MSLILGIYSKKGKIDHDLIQPVIADFRKHGETGLLAGSRFLLAGHDRRHAEGNVIESPEKGLVAGAAGEFLVSRSDITALQNAGHEINSDSNSATFGLHSFLVDGINFLKKMRGHFSFACYDVYKDELWLANDHWGIYPLFVYSDPEYFIFSSEYEPVLKYPGFKSGIDEESLTEYLVLGAPLGGKTFFKDLRNLAPATILRIRGDEVAESCFHKADTSIDTKKSADDHAAGFAAAFRQAVQIRAEHSENLCCSLTGGLDTRLILSAFPEEKRKDARFITLLTEPLAEEEDRDIIIAKMIATQFGLKHVVEPMSDWTDVWTRDFDASFFSGVRFRHKDYLLSGHYGSELVKGEFTSLLPARIANRIEGENKGPLKSLFKKQKANVAADQAVSDIFKAGFAKNIPSAYENLEKEYGSMACENRELELGIRYMTRSFFSSMYGGSYGSWLMTYRFPIDWCLPFLDGEVLRILLSMPPAAIIRKDQRFYDILYRNHFPGLTGIPTSSSFGEMPGHCIGFYGRAKEPKHEKLPRYEKAFEHILANGPAGEIDIFDMDKISKYRGRGNHPDVRAFIEFQMWWRSVFQK